MSGVSLFLPVSGLVRGDWFEMVRVSVVDKFVGRLLLEFEG